jgi:hypothetical protein
MKLSEMKPQTARRYIRKAKQSSVFGQQVAQMDQEDLLIAVGVYAMEVERLRSALSKSRDASSYTLINSYLMHES